MQGIWQRLFSPLFDQVSDELQRNMTGLRVGCGRTGPSQRDPREIRFVLGKLDRVDDGQCQPADAPHRWQHPVMRQRGMVPRGACVPGCCLCGLIVVFSLWSAVHGVWSIFKIQDILRKTFGSISWVHFQNSHVASCVLPLDSVPPPRSLFRGQGFWGIVGAHWISWPECAERRAPEFRRMTWCRLTVEG